MIINQKSAEYYYALSFDYNLTFLFCGKLHMPIYDRMLLMVYNKDGNDLAINYTEFKKDKLLEGGCLRHTFLAKIESSQILNMVLSGNFGDIEGEFCQGVLSGLDKYNELKQS